MNSEIADALVRPIGVGHGRCPPTSPACSPSTTDAEAIRSIVEDTYADSAHMLQAHVNCKIIAMIALAVCRGRGVQAEIRFGEPYHWFVELFDGQTIDSEPGSGRVRLARLQSDAGWNEPA
jgi:hypothetical protein